MSSAKCVVNDRINAPGLAWWIKVAEFVEVVKAQSVTTETLAQKNCLGSES